MVALRKLTEEEAALAAILMDETGIDMLEFAGVDETKPDRCLRLRPYQWKWYVNDAKNSISACARDVGKSFRIIGKALAHPHASPGTDFFITAPGADHLKPLADKIEEWLMQIKLLRVMLRANYGKTGISKIPSFEARFKNGSKIITRLPKQDGKGVKGSVDADAIIVTQRGLLPAREVVAGDLVLTHHNRWKPVLWASVYENDDVWILRGGGNSELIVSGNHRMMVRERTSGPKQARELSPRIETIMPIDALEQGENIGLFSLGSPTVFADGPSPDRDLTPGLARLIGRWLADGHTNWTQNRPTQKRYGMISITVSAEQLSDVLGFFADAGISPTVHLRRHNGTYAVNHRDSELTSWLEQEFGKLAQGKTLPTWMLYQPVDIRRSLLEGYLSGDGSRDEAKRRWVAGTASRQLAVGIRLLGQSVGYHGSIRRQRISVKQICGRELKAPARDSWRVTLSEVGKKHHPGRSSEWVKLDSVTQLDYPIEVADIRVADDSSFVVDGLYSHNQHAKKVIVDEGQDFPELAWDQLYPTLRADLPGAQMEIYGVTVGSNSTFDKHADDPDSVYVLTRKIAPERPSWGPEERKAAIKKYGSETSIRYSQNIFGVSSGTYSDLFVTARLMSCVRIQESEWAKRYNDEVYRHIEIEDDRLRGSSKKPVDLLVLPDSHLEKQYVSYWGGWDIGLTNDASEMFVFGAFQKPSHTELSYRLLTRVSMSGITAPNQVQVLTWLLDFYGPRFQRLGLDGTGLGLPIAQTIDTLPGYRDKVRGYGFSEKLIAGWEDRKLEPGEKLKDIEMRSRTPDYGLARLRELVDSGRWELPMDVDLLSSLQGISDDHCLHGCYMFGVALGQHGIESKLAALTERGPVRVRVGWG